MQNDEPKVETTVATDKKKSAVDCSNRLKMAKMPLVFSLLALIGSGFAISQQYQTKQGESESNDTTQIASMAQIISQQNQQLQTLKQNIQSLQTSLQSYTDQRVAQSNAQMSQLADQVNALNALVKSPHTHLAQMRASVQLQSAIYSLVYAQQALAILGDPKLAQQWTQHAQQSLAQTNYATELQPAFTEIQQALTTTLSNVEVQKAVTQLMINLKDLTLKTPYQMEVRNEPSEGIWAQLKSFMSVQKVDSTSHSLWTEQDRMQAVETIRLAMTIAQTQLLQGDVDAYQASVSEITAYVQAYYIDNPVRQQWLTELTSIRYPSHQNLMVQFDSLIEQLQSTQSQLQES